MYTQDRSRCDRIDRGAGRIDRMLQESLGTRHTSAPRFQEIFVTLTACLDVTFFQKDPRADAAPMPVNSASRASISFNGCAALEDPPSTLGQFYLFLVCFTISQRTLERAPMRASRVFWQALGQAHTASQRHVRSCASCLGTGHVASKQAVSVTNISWKRGNLVCPVPRLVRASNRSCTLKIDPGLA